MNNIINDKQYTFSEIDIKSATRKGKGVFVTIYKNGGISISKGLVSLFIDHDLISDKHIKCLFDVTNKAILIKHTQDQGKNTFTIYINENKNYGRIIGRSLSNEIFQRFSNNPDVKYFRSKSCEWNNDYQGIVVRFE